MGYSLGDPTFLLYCTRTVYSERHYDLCGIILENVVLIPPHVVDVVHVVEYVVKAKALKAVITQFPSLIFARFLHRDRPLYSCIGYSVSPAILTCGRGALTAVVCRSQDKPPQPATECVLCPTAAKSRVINAVHDIGTQDARPRHAIGL